jgi:hypothetical protein
MLTDLGSNCFGDADIGPLCFLSNLSWILLSWVEMLLGKKKMTLKKGVWVHLLFAANLLLCMPEHTARRRKS